VAGIVLARLHELTAEPRWKERAAALTSAFAGRAAELGLYAATYLLAVDWLVNPGFHLVVVGDRADATSHEMHGAALAGFLPRRVVQLVEATEESERRLPAPIRGMVALGRATRGYACSGTSCSPPVEELGAWQSTLESLHPMVSA
jgi:uncharacterized protein YyaL (SSP411 family)